MLCGPHACLPSFTCNMADAIDIDIDDEEFHEEGEDNVQKLKSSVAKSKGRGFKGSSGRETDDTYGSLYDEDAASEDTSALRSIEGWILFITNVHEEAHEDDLRDAFADFGEIKNVHLNLDRRTGFLKGYSLMEFETYPEAQKAMDGMNGSEILGQIVHVDWAFVKGPHGNKHSRHRERRR